MIVSVITTTYNGLPFLTEAIESVLSQTLADFEYVLVDDGSTDETPHTVRAISDTRLQYVRADRIGRAAALNLALSKTEGQYVANLDADDWMLPERLAEQKAFLDTNQDVVMVGSAYYLHHPDGKRNLVEFPLDDSALRRRLFQGYPFVHSAVMYRRKSLVAAGGFDESLPCSIDYDACTRLALTGHLANLPTPLAVRRIHGTNYFMKRISPGQYTAALTRIRWRYWLKSGRPLSLLPVTLSTIAASGVRKWVQHWQAR